MLLQLSNFPPAVAVTSSIHLAENPKFPEFVYVINIKWGLILRRKFWMLSESHNYPRMDFQLGEIYVHISNTHGSLVN